MEDLRGRQRQHMDHQRREEFVPGRPECSHHSEASGLPGREGEQAAPSPPALTLRLVLTTQRMGWVTRGPLGPILTPIGGSPPAPAQPSLPAPASPGPAGSRAAARAGGARRPAAHLGEAEACWYPSAHGRSQPQAAWLPGLLRASHGAKGSALGTSTVGREVEPGWTEGWGPQAPRGPAAWPTAEAPPPEDPRSLECPQAALYGPLPRGTEAFSAQLR